MDRVRALLAHVDVIRLDHFRGFAAAWHVPAGATSARTGEWAPGPGEALFEAVRAEFGGLPFIAEDLGVITPDVRALCDALRTPGTRVLQFAFDGGRDNPYLPHNFITNTVVYTGTHDNAPTREWYEELPGETKRFFWSYLGRDTGAGADECAGARGRQLAVALPRESAVARGARVAARDHARFGKVGNERRGRNSVQTTRRCLRQELKRNIAL